MTGTTTDRRVLLLAPDDNIAVAAREIAAGSKVMVGGREIALRGDIDVGHKFAIRRIAKGERVYKYRAPIGRALADIDVGEYVHIHNLGSDYIPTYTLDHGHEYLKEKT